MALRIFEFDGDRFGGGVAVTILRKGATCSGKRHRGTNDKSHAKFSFVDCKTWTFGLAG
jgi:hypothetical protein